MKQYDAAADYRNYVVTDDDSPFVTTRQAATRLRVSTTQAVRSMVRLGSLPARQTDAEYNPRYLIPAWALDGLVALRAGSDPAPAPARSEVSETSADRIRVLEDALVAVREAREHEERAAALQAEAAQELARANAILHKAVTDVLVPQRVIDSS